MRPRRIYVELFDAFWSMVEADWLRLAIGTLQGCDGYDLDDPASGAVRLARPPRGVKRWHAADGSRDWYAEDGVVLKRPLDWRPEDWHDEVADVAS
jgi:hypothetical protein